MTASPDDDATGRLKRVAGSRIGRRARSMALTSLAAVLSAALSAGALAGSAEAALADDSSHSSTDQSSIAEIDPTADKAADGVVSAFDSAVDAATPVFDGSSGISGEMNFDYYPGSGSVIVTAYRELSAGGDEGIWEAVSTTEISRTISDYSLPVPPGSYQVAFRESEGYFFPQVFPGIFGADPSRDVSGAEQVVVREGRYTPGVDATMVTTNPSISGSVFRGADETLNVYVSVEKFDSTQNKWSQVESESIGRNRTYAFEGLVSGSYRVSAVKYYNFASPVHTFEVTSGSTEIADLELLPTTSGISGTIKGAIQKSTRVTAWRHYGSKEFGEWRDVYTTYSDVDGSYSIALFPGQYAVTFAEASDLDRRQVYKNLNTNRPLEDVVGLDTVDVKSEPVTGIDATLAPAVHSMFGTVALAGASEEETELILAYVNTSGEWVEKYKPFKTYTSKGVRYYYADGLRDGNYRLTVDGGPYFSSPSQQIMVSDGTSEKFELSLDPLPTSTITGTLFSSAPATYTSEVEAWKSTDEGWIKVVGKLVRRDVAFALNVPYGEYRIRATDRYEKLQTQVYDGINTRLPVESVSNATSVSVGETATQPIEMNLVSEVPVSGVVSDHYGLAREVTVALYVWNEDSNRLDYRRQTKTRDDGTYSLGGLFPGDLFTLHFEPRHSGGIPTAGWLNSASSPTSSDGLVVVGSQSSTIDFTMSSRATVSGIVIAPDGSPAAGVRVTLGGWRGPGWEVVDSATSESDGTYIFPLPSSYAYSVRAATRTLAANYGGGSGRQQAPAPGNYFYAADGAVPDALLTLAPKTPTLGVGAVQQLDYCRDTALAPSDDGSSEEVQLPFAIEFFGKKQSSAFVNTNGSITFDSPYANVRWNVLSSNIGVPLIAPFHSDVDTRDVEGGVVTYGSSPDRKSFCVTWSDVGYFEWESDRLNNFQVLLTDRSTGSPSSANDFDITFNYNEIGWSEGGSSWQKVGGVPASAGYSAGTGKAGTFVDLKDPMYQYGDYGDDSDDALVAGSLNSSQLGRYVFKIRETDEVPGEEPTDDPVKPDEPGVGTELPSLAVDTPAIVGSARVGTTVQASSVGMPPWAKKSGQWNRVSASKKVTPIRGATGATYKIDAADAGQALTYTLTVAKSGYTSAIVTSKPTAKVINVFTATPTPKITGTAKVKKTLKVSVGAWKPSGMKLSYQWYSNGKAISGAKSASYKIAKKYKKAKITVSVTGTKSGYVTVVKKSKPTKAVK